MQLSDKDLQALDWLMNQRQQPAASSPSPTLAADAVEPERLQRVEALLNLIGQMPADEPPANLVARTLERIQHAPLAPAAREDTAGLPLPLAADHPHA
jgi:hypothetical protein